MTTNSPGKSRGRNTWAFWMSNTFGTQVAPLWDRALRMCWIPPVI
jgi:hypothetical protein